MNIKSKLEQAIALLNRPVLEFSSASREKCVPVANDSERSVLKMTNNTQITVRDQSAAIACVQDTDEIVSNGETSRDKRNREDVNIVLQQLSELRNFVFSNSSRRRKAGDV